MKREKAGVRRKPHTWRGLTAASESCEDSSFDGESSVYSLWRWAGHSSKNPKNFLKISDWVLMHF